MTNSFVVDKQSRLDVFLVKNLKDDFSRVEIQNFIKNEKAKVNCKVITKCSFKVNEGDVVDVSCEIKKKDTSLKPKDMSLKIIYEDNDLLVIDKPAGLTVHPGAGNQNDTLVNGLLALVQKGRITLSNERGNERLGIVHRLDKDTSGLMVVAKHNKSHRILSDMFKTHEIDRRYIAIVHGVPIPPAGKIENFICRDKKHIQKMKICDKDEKKAKVAITNYKVLKTLNNSKYSLIECRLETGRTHQIRLHMLSIGHPLVGEQLYTSANYKNEDKKNCYTRQMLHSYKLHFTNPINRKTIDLNIDNEDFNTFVINAENFLN